MELYTLVNGDKKILYKADNLKNIYIEENKSNTDLLSKDTIENIKRNLYLTIETRDEQNKVYKYECKLTFKEKFNNNKLTYKTYVKDSNYETRTLSNDNLSLFNNSYAPSNIPTDDVTSDKTIKTFSEHDAPETKLAILGYKFDKEKGSFIRNLDKDTEIKIIVSNGVLIYSKQVNNYSEIIKYYYTSKRVNYSFLSNNNLNKTHFIYDVPNNSLNCIKGDCKNYQVKINYILSIYSELKQTL